MKDISLKALPLKNSIDFKKYSQLLSIIESNDPFHKIGLVFNANSGGERLNYFLFTINGVPKIIMIFILRNIDIESESTPYKDVISPYGYSGPLISRDTSNKEVSLFWNAVDNWYKKNNVITEFIRFSLNNNKREYTGSVIPTLDNVRGVILDEKSQWENFDKKVRNNYRKALKSDLTFKLYYKNITTEILEDFYHIYNSTMIRRNADSQFFYPFNYFESYVRSNIDNCAIAMTYYNGVSIATEFLLLSNDTIYSYLGGTNSNYFNARPNDFLKVNVLAWGRKLNFNYYLLGGGRINGDQLYAYKKAFFPKDEDVIFYTGRKIINHDIYNELLLKTRNTNRERLKNENESSTNYFPEYRVGN